jgi:hypothetical protein
LLRSSPLPCILRTLAISFLASLHFSENHGVSVFPHLFGFRGFFSCISLTTPAVTDAFNIYYSTCAARFSLLVLVDVTSLVNSVMKSYFPVKSVQACADFMYSFMFAPSTHLYISMGSSSSCLLVDLPGQFGTGIYVVTRMWSDNPFSVSESYSSFWVGSLEMIRSIHD